MSSVPEIVEPGLQADQRLLDRAWLRIGAGLAVAGQAMVFSFTANLTPPEGWSFWVVHGGLILSTILVLVFLGRDLIQSAFDAVREFKISIDLLFFVSLVGALAGSLTATLTRQGSVYYEVVAILIVVHTAGKMLGARSRVAALRAVDRTRETFDQCLVRGADGKPTSKAVAALNVSDIVWVPVGGPICVDGEILSGNGYVQEASMTGEWRPVTRGVGDQIFAGTYAVDGAFEIKPTLEKRRLDSVLAAIEQARLAPSALQQQADRLMAWFLPLVLTVSGGTFLFWWLRGSWSVALFNSMAVLLVACPCAMGLATPVAIWGGLARLASFGLVARTGDFIDALARADTICFDKTGTLSEEKLSVHSWRTESAWQSRERWLKGAVAAIESGQRHPIAAALSEACAVAGDRPPKIESIRIEPGLGVIGVIRDESGTPVEICVGERELVGRRVPATAFGDNSSNAKIIFISVNNELAARAELDERWRANLSEVFTELNDLELQLEVMSGDPQAESFAPRLELKIPIHAGLNPVQKERRIQKLRDEGRLVIFVGDGLNDTAAMSAADASIAIRTGAELARASASSVFAGDDLRFLPRAIRFSRSVRSSIRGNLIFAAGYNIVGMAFAASGRLHPVIAALLMVGSSAAVSYRALRAANREAPFRTSDALP